MKAKRVRWPNVEFKYKNNVEKDDINVNCNADIKKEKKKTILAYVKKVSKISVNVDIDFEMPRAVDDRKGTSERFAKEKKSALID